MLQALLRTITEILDSKKAAYSFIATIGACVLHLYFNVDVTSALLLVSPLGIATVSQAYVDASAAKQPKPAPSAPSNAGPPAPADPAPTPAADPVAPPAPEPSAAAPDATKAE